MTHVLYDADRDGLLGGFAAWLALGDDDVRYTERTSREAAPDFVHADERPDRLILIDFAYPLDEIERLSARYDVLVIDHHKSFMEEVRQATGDAFYDDLDAHCAEVTLPSGAKFDYVYDRRRSGAGLAWDYFHVDPRPALIDHVEDYDLWRWAMPFTDEVCLGIDHLVSGAEGERAFDILRFYASRDLSDVIHLGHVLAAARDRIIEEAVARAQIVNFPVEIDVTVPAVLLTSLPKAYVSKACNAALDAYPEAMIAAHQYIDYGSREVGYGLRGRGDFDVGTVASVLGGGGHHNAAGFRLSMDAGDIGYFPTAWSPEEH